MVLGLEVWRGGVGVRVGWGGRVFCKVRWRSVIRGLGSELGLGVGGSGAGCNRKRRRCFLFQSELRISSDALHKGKNKQKQYLLLHSVVFCVVEGVVLCLGFRV